jgi:hypothetical protein
MNTTTIAPTADLLDGLTGIAADLSGADLHTVRSLAARLLSRNSDDAGKRGRSGLNNNASPLELCLSSFADACRFRFVADPASTQPDPRLRRDASLAALATTLDMTQCGALEPLCRATLDAIIPNDERIDRYVEGVLWLGAGIGMPGVALYADLTKGDPDERWERTESWLASIVANAAPARGILAAMRAAGADLMAAGVEGTEPANARAKLFFRISRPIALAEIGNPAFADPSISVFLAMLLGERELPLAGLVFSTSFLVANGMPFDAKVDVCAHCLGFSNEDWISFLGAATEAFQLAPMDARRALSGDADAAFVGLNRNAMGQLRLDFFLKPRDWYAEEGHA